MTFAPKTVGPAMRLLVLAAFTVGLGLVGRYLYRQIKPLPSQSAASPQLTEKQSETSRSDE
jgi:hypothetical protein